MIIICQFASDWLMIVVFNLLYKLINSVKNLENGTSTTESLREYCSRPLRRSFVPTQLVYAIAKKKTSKRNYIGKAV